MALLQLIAIQYYIYYILTAASTFITIGSSQINIINIIASITKAISDSFQDKEGIARCLSQFKGRRIIKHCVSQVAYQLEEDLKSPIIE
jgi:hypothetical protein